MKTLSLFLIAFLVFGGYPVTAQDWEDLNPGAGGQVQDIVCDPNIQGRLFLVSDMEGVYRSTDNGISWQYTSDDLIHHRTYAVVPDPSNSERVYAGTLYGLHYSDNGGINWNVIEETKGYSIGAVAVDPEDSQHILAAIGWRDDYNFGGGVNTHDIDDRLTVFRSTDGGASWNTLFLDNIATTDPNTYTITFDPSDNNSIYLASAKGLYQSTDGGVTWSLIEAPDNTFSCTGLGLSPDGKYMYVTYQLGDNKSSSPAGLFASLTENVRWTRITQDAEFEDNYLLWYPEVSPESSEDEHRVLLPLLKARPGLFELVIDWTGDVPRYTYETIWTRELNVDGYDPGWEYSQPGPRVAHYTPASWNENTIWSTINQSMLRGVKNDDGSYTWQNRYSIRNEEIQYEFWGDTTYGYASRGTASTYTFDVAAYENYVVQGQADNGLMESWDYGYSWSNIQGRAQFIYDARAVAVAKAGSANVVLAQGASAFGGNARTASLYMKELTNLDPSDRWVLIGAGETQQGGLPYNDYIHEISVNPNNQNQVFISYDQSGVYLIEDLGAFVSDSTVVATKVSPSNIQAIREIAFHPTNQDVIYATVIRGETGLYRGVKTDDNAYEWRKLIDGSGGSAQVKAWRYNDKNYFLYTAKNINGIEDYSAAFFNDSGKADVIFTPEEARTLRTNPWYADIASRYDFDIGGVAVYENQIILSYYDHTWAKGYGLFKGTLNGNEEVQWEDWTANNHFKGGTDAEVFTIQGAPYYYQGSQGVGMWRRQVSDNSPLPSDDNGTVVIRAQGKSGNEQIDLLLNGEKIGETVSLTTTMADYTWADVPGSGTLQVTFINDDDPFNDDVRVDYLAWNELVHQAEDQVTNTGSYDLENQRCGGVKSEWLYCGGYIEFPMVGQPNTSAATNGGALARVSGSELYPNPADNIVNIKMNSAPIASVTVYNATGAPVIQTSQLSNRQLDVSNVPQGLYLVEVRLADGSTESQRLIIGSR